VELILSDGSDYPLTGLINFGDREVAVQSDQFDQLALVLRAVTPALRHGHSLKSGFAISARC